MYNELIFLNEKIMHIFEVIEYCLKNADHLKMILSVRIYHKILQEFTTNKRIAFILLTEFPHHPSHLFKIYYLKYIITQHVLNTTANSSNAYSSLN